jgi:hypothetical protein
VTRTAADALGGVRQIEEGGHRGGELLSATAAEWVGVCFQKQARSARAEVIVLAAARTARRVTCLEKTDRTVLHRTRLGGPPRVPAAHEQGANPERDTPTIGSRLANSSVPKPKKEPRRARKASKRPAPQGLALAKPGEPVGKPCDGQSLAGQGSQGCPEAWHSHPH